MPKLEAYHRKLPYSYALGIFPSLQLLETRPEIVERLLLNPEGLNSEGVEKLRARCDSLGIREEMAERVLRRESQKDNCYAGLVFQKYEDALSPEASHAVLCQISDAGNAGTALRSLLAFDLRDVCFVRPCVDRFDPHVIRASMGALFHMRTCQVESFEAYSEACPGRSLYPFMLKGSMELNEAAQMAASPYTLIFGNEATGLPERFANVGQPVRIPQSPLVDSLNLGVAVSIGAYMFKTKAGV